MQHLVDLHKVLFNPQGKSKSNYVKNRSGVLQAKKYPSLFINKEGYC